VIYNNYHRKSQLHSLYAIKSPESTPENPIIYVASYHQIEFQFPDQFKTTWYRINVNQVKPGSATREEIFALITYNYGHCEKSLSSATEAFALMDCDMSGFNLPTNGIQINFLNAMRHYATSTKRIIEAGANAQWLYDTVMNMIDRMVEHSKRRSVNNELNEQSAQQTKPEQTTIYHKYAAEKVKNIQISAYS